MGPDRSRSCFIIEFIRAPMPVIGSDGALLGTVETRRGDWIILERAEDEASGLKRGFSSDWVMAVGNAVILFKTAEQVRRVWAMDDEMPAPLTRDFDLPPLAHEQGSTFLWNSEH